MFKCKIFEGRRQRGELLIKETWSEATGAPLADTYV